MSHRPDNWSDESRHRGRIGGYDGPTDGYGSQSSGYDGSSEGYDPTQPYDGPSQYDGPTIEIPTLPAGGSRSG